MYPMQNHYTVDGIEKTLMFFKTFVTTADFNFPLINTDFTCL